MGRSEGGRLIHDKRPSNERGEGEDVRESVSPLGHLIRGYSLQRRCSIQTSSSITERMPCQGWVASCVLLYNGQHKKCGVIDT